VARAGEGQGAAAPPYQTESGQAAGRGEAKVSLAFANIGMRIASAWKPSGSRKIGPWIASCLDAMVARADALRSGAAAARLRGSGAGERELRCGPAPPRLHLAAAAS
jgi:hypothetical protein